MGTVPVATATAQEPRLGGPEATGSTTESPPAAQPPGAAAIPPGRGQPLTARERHPRARGTTLLIGCGGREGGSKSVGASRKNDVMPRLLKGTGPSRRGWRRRGPRALACSRITDTRAGLVRARGLCRRERAGRGQPQGSGEAAWGEVRPAD